MGFVKVKINAGTFDPDQNFWELNPQLRYYDPYSTFYAEDKSKNHKVSSDAMWFCFFMSYEGEENVFIRIDPMERSKMLIENLGLQPVSNDPVFEKVKQAFPEDCLSFIERQLKIEQDALRKRTDLLRDTTLTLDRTEYDDKGKPYTVKGTATQINKLQVDSLRIYENYEKILDKFTTDQTKTTARGGRKLTKAERGEI